jgi:glycosyltransferase involved in cell wall biosynthesis
MRIAIVHDWLIGMRGGERILDIFCEIFPEAEIFTLIYRKGALTSRIESRPIHTSFLQKFPFIKEKYRNYLPLFPIAVESFNLKKFDLIISSSHCVAKGAKKRKDAYHFCYCYTPMRYIWVFFDQYFGNYPLWKKLVIKGVGKYLKRWDIVTLDRVDEFIAISKTIQKRIKNIYKRDSTVIYPPVEVDKFKVDTSIKKEDFYLCVSALVPYKRIDIIIDAFNELKDKKLFIVGDGNIRGELERKKISDNVKFLGWINHNHLNELYQKAKAFIYAAEEDFGIAPVEAQAAGTPVIAYGRGGTSETVVPLNGEKKQKPTGLFFFQQSKEALIEAIEEFEKNQNVFSPYEIRENALRFSKESFIKNIKNFIKNKVGYND